MKQRFAPLSLQSTSLLTPLEPVDEGPPMITDILTDTLPVAGQPFGGHDRLSIHSPFTGEQVGEIATATTEDMSRAVAAAARALRDPMPSWQRAQILDHA